MTPPFWFAKPKAAEPDVWDQSTAHVAPYHLPFDGHLPALVCGPGKHAFARYLAATLTATRPIHVLDASGALSFEVPGRDVVVHRPENFDLDADFFADATRALVEISTTPGSVMIIDEFLYLMEPYPTPMPQQQEFLAALEAAMPLCRRNRSRLVMLSTIIPKKDYMARFGCRFFIGPMTPMDWVLMYNREAAQVDTPGRPGTGVVFLDGQFDTVEFRLFARPQTAPQVAPSSTGGGRRRR